MTRAGVAIVTQCYRPAYRFGVGVGLSTIALGQDILTLCYAKLSFHHLPSCVPHIFNLSTTCFYQQQCQHLGLEIYHALF